MKIQILTDKKSWFYKNKDKIPNRFKRFKNRLISSHYNIKKNNDLTFIISYYKIIPKKFYLIQNII